jgi:hypothetical protein
MAEDPVAAEGAVVGADEEAVTGEGEAVGADEGAVAGLSGGL